MNLISADNAFRLVGVRLFKQFGVVFNVRRFNFGRHAFFSVDDPDIPSFYVLFKKCFFREFNSFFRVFVSENPSFEGEGESVNEDFLDLAISLGSSFFLFVYPSGEVFSVPVLLVKKFCDKFGLRRVQEVVNAYKCGDGVGGVVSVHEFTYSFPVCLFEKWGDLKR